MQLMRERLFTDDAAVVIQIVCFMNKKRNLNMHQYFPSLLQLCQLSQQEERKI